jgi:hypothetical protein
MDAATEDIAVITVFLIVLTNAEESDILPDFILSGV